MTPSWLPLRTNSTRRSRSPTTALTTGAKVATSRNLSNLGLRALRSLDHSGPVLESKKKKNLRLYGTNLRKTMTEPWGTPQCSRNHSLHMQPISLPPQIPVILPVRQESSKWVTSLLLDDARDELWSCNADEVIRTQLPAPHGPIDLLNFTLQNMFVDLEKWGLIFMWLYCWCSTLTYSLWHFNVWYFYVGIFIFHM